MKSNSKNKSMIDKKAKQLLSEKKSVETKPVKQTVAVSKTSPTVKKAAESKKQSVSKEKATTEKPAKKVTAKAEKSVTKKATEVKKAVADSTSAKVKEVKPKKVKEIVTKKAAPVKKDTAKKTAKTKAVKETITKPVVEKKETEPVKKTAKKPVAKKESKKQATVKETAVKATEKKKPTKKTATKKKIAKPEQSDTSVTEVKTDTTVTKPKVVPVAEPKPVETIAAENQSEFPVMLDDIYNTPRKSVAFIGSECYPFVKTGGLGDVMYALPKALAKLNCDVKVILPRYKCIPWEYQEKMVYRGSFYMNLCSDGRQFYVGIMEYVWDGVVYDFIDNEEFFNTGNPYTNLVDDIPKFCFFAKAALAALNYMDWIPDIIHCHDWQASLVPVYLRTMFENTKLTTAKTILTIHNLKFQGIYNIPTIKYWSGLPDHIFTDDSLKDGDNDANMLKGGLKYCNIITTVSNTYAGEIQNPEYGENLDAHLRYHSGKLRGIVNGIDYDIWNTNNDEHIYVNYNAEDAIAKKCDNKLKLQEELGLVQDEHKFVIGLISRLTDQKGLDLINSIIPQIMDEHTQLVILGTGEPHYEDSFRYYEGAYKGNVCSNIMYDETRAHRIYAGADALLVPSKFEPCGLTQLIGMHYGTIPVVRETGGLKDTVEPYNMFTDSGNGFTFDKYDAQLLLDAINRAKTLYFTARPSWDKMVVRDMNKDLSWFNSAKQYKYLYLDLLK